MGVLLFQHRFFQPVSLSETFNLQHESVLGRGAWLPRVMNTGTVFQGANSSPLINGLRLPIQLPEATSQAADTSDVNYFQPGMGLNLTQALLKSIANDMGVPGPVFAFGFEG